MSAVEEFEEFQQYWQDIESMDDLVGVLRYSTPPPIYRREWENLRKAFFEFDDLMWQRPNPILVQVLAKET